MENASKALIIASSVLIGVVILSLLVAFFNNVKSLQQRKADEVKIKQDVEFNKKYEAYNREVYGSELLSIAKQIEDYNIREGDTKGYTKIDLVVDITDDLDYFLFKKGIYNQETLNSAIDRIENELVTTGRPNTTVANHYFTGVGGQSRRTYQLATMRTKEIKDFLGIKDSERIPDEMQNYINTYNTLKSLLTQIKSTKFECTGFEYEQYTGRVTKMKYRLASSYIKKNERIQVK